ncbi:MAG TPA: glutathione-disulfide reductase [Burkholderiales bacterium]|nr:glutathione-disulfide reductase [Burkholderiales bacterium]
MPRYDYDLITIGGGSGGVRASRMAANFGARVALIEAHRLGGTCVNVGCIPKKLLSYAAHYAHDFADAAGFGWDRVQPGFDWAQLIANKDREITRLNGVYARLLNDAGVRVIEARGELVDAHAVKAGESVLTAQHILIATGGWPTVPQIPGAELAITSNEAFYLKSLPARAIVVGGGYISAEFSSIFNGLGSKTMLVYRGQRLLRGFDPDVGRVLAEEMAQNGVELLLGSNIERIERRGEALAVKLASGEIRETDLVLYATGRAPNTRGIGLEAAGVALAASGAIKVDDFFRSSIPSIHAIGDAIDRIQLTPVAIAEGMALANTLFNNSPRRMDYSNVPTAVFSHPNVATVGLGEDEARERHGEIEVYAARFRPLKATLSGSAGRVFMKLIVDRKTDRVLGVHMVGADAGEVIQGFAVALKCGATKAQFDATIGIHPTGAEEFVTMREARRAQ